MNKTAIAFLTTFFLTMSAMQAEASSFNPFESLGTNSGAYINYKAVNKMDNKTITLATLPTTAAQVSPGTNAHQVAAYAIASLARYEHDPEGAIAMLNVLRGPRPVSEYDKQFMRERFRNCPYIARSFFKGATPQNNYTPAQPYAVTVESTPYTYQEAGYAKFYLHSGGADNSRPIVLRQKGSTGEWFLWECNNLLGQIRMPVKDDPWA